MTPATIKPTETIASTAPGASLRRRARRRTHLCRQGSRVDVRLWVPTTAIFVLLAPFALVLTPLLYLAPRTVRPDPFRAVATLGRLLLTLSGTVVEVDCPDARVRLRCF